MGYINCIIREILLLSMHLKKLLDKQTSASAAKGYVKGYDP